MPAMAPVAAPAATALHSGASLTTSGFTPAVRTVAASLGVDLTRVTGTGVGGRVTVNDVRAAADPAFPARVAAAQRVEDDFRLSTDPGRWPTGSAELDERIRTVPPRFYDVTAAVHRGPVTAAAEPILYDSKMLPTVHFDGPPPAGSGSTPEGATTRYEGPRGPWLLNADDPARDPSNFPSLYYSEP